MQGIEATFDDLSFEGGDSPQRVLPKIVPGAAALALAGAVSVWALHWVSPGIPEAVFSGWAPASAVSKPFADIAIDANLLAQLKSAAPGAPSEQVASLETAPSVSSAPFPLPRLEPFPPLPRSRRRRACRCRLGVMRPRSARRKASPCRRFVRLDSAPRRSPRRLSAMRHVPTWRSLHPPLRPTIATSSRSCSDGRTHPRRSSLPQHWRAGHHPVGHRTATGASSQPPAALAEARCSASRLPSEIPPQDIPAMTTIPPSTTSRRASSICRTEHGSKPIRVWGRRSTIHATWPSARWARRRRMSTS